MNLIEVKKVYKTIEDKIKHLNKFEKTNLLKKIYLELQTEYQVNLKDRANHYARKDANGNIQEPYYYFLMNQSELDLFEVVANKHLSLGKSIPSKQNHNLNPVNPVDTEINNNNKNIYMLIKIINKISQIYSNLSEENKKLFEKNLMKNLTKNQCNVYNRKAEDITTIKSYIENQNQFILDIASRVKIEDIQNIIKAMQTTKTELKIA